LVNVIGKFEGDNFFLSNFYEAPTVFSSPLAGELTFQTGEAAFQAAKFHAMTGSDQEKISYLQKVAEAPTPSKAKYAGRSVKIDLELWEQVKVKCMREVVFQKFQQHSDLRIKLMQTGHAMLVEGNTWGDTFWGRCEGKGFNILGAILMEVRGYWLWTAESNRRSFERDMG
jgi:ribA/ribD-fused uncharacterized protein